MADGAAVFEMVSRASQKRDFFITREVFANTDSFIHFANGRLIDATVIILPLLLGLTAAGIVGNIVVSGLNYAPKGLKPNWAALNPFKGFGNLFSGAFRNNPGCFNSETWQSS